MGLRQKDGHAGVFHVEDHSKKFEMGILKPRTFIGTSPRRTGMPALSVMLHCHGRPHTNCFTFSERELTEHLQYRTRCFVQDDTDHWLRIGF